MPRPETRLPRFVTAYCACGAYCVNLLPAEFQHWVQAHQRPECKSVSKEEFNRRNVRGQAAPWEPESNVL